MNGSSHPRTLRWHLWRHNLLALGLASASFVGALLLWGLLGLGTYWFTLLWATIGRATNPEHSLEIFDARDLVGPWFWPAFGAGAVALMLLAGAVRQGNWANRLCDSPFYVLWALVELLLMAPGALFASWGNLRAMVWLGTTNRRLAWALLQTVGRHERLNEALPLAAAAAEIGITARSLPRLKRALFALQMTGLVILREGTGEGWRLTLSGEAARALLGETTPGPETQTPAR